ncbi:MAG: DNA mismatch repair endonuclease MutL [Thermodesulfobacteria bacterium]|nr:DNA mismatch repair endonuclease MutL [Thermodesulfobacteriota bacterium]
MPRIQILPEKVARKIAAGEVIERPASVVKELCENAFDARARNVEVEAWDGGLSLIRVRDDGCGMAPEDLKLCYLPHATSKIKDEEDLLRIGTWGFRGEALASIAAVSELTISSRQKEALLGGRIKVRFGKLLSFSEKGLAPGTVVEVSNLFGNVPARRAFLKSPRAEAARISDIVKFLAFENPEVNLNLALNGRQTFRYQASKGRKGLLASLTKIKEAAFLEDHFEEGPYRLEIILSPSGHTFPTPRFFFFLVNNRVVKDRLLSAAVNEALKTYFPKGQYPALLLALETAPELVDVNVHPAKWEVRFREEARVFSLARKAVESLFKPRFRQVSAPEREESPEEDLPYKTDDEERFWDTIPRVAEKGPALKFEQDFLAPLEILGPFGKEFYLLKDGDALVFFDFHAAQERLLFEKLKETFAREGKIPGQNLLAAEPLHLSPSAFARLEENLPLLEKLGFEVEILAAGEALLRASPAVLGAKASGALEALLEEGPLEDLLEEVLARLACQAAKKAGDFLSDPEILGLYLETKKQGFDRCPHGRPFKWSISLEEVRKRLGRTP